MSFQLGIGSLGGTLFFLVELFIPLGNMIIIYTKTKNVEGRHAIIIFDH